MDPINLRGADMRDAQPVRPRKPRRKFNLRYKALGGAIAVGALLVGGAAYADTVTSVSYATATASPVVASNVKITSNVSTKITLQNEKSSGGSTSSKCYRGSTFKSIFKAHPSAKCVVITKNGQKFLNSAISASGKRVWFNDYVGSSDSKAGTKSATWYWDSKSKAWHKGNCWNTNKLQGYKPAAHSVSYYHLVSKITYTLTETLSSEGKVVVTANASCVQGGASASASAQAIAAASAKLSITVTGTSTADVKAKSKAAAKALAKKIQDAAKAAAISKAKSTAKGSITITLEAQASASASCTQTTSSSTPPPSSTPPVTTPPVTTPPVTTPPPTKTPQPIQVCRLSDKQIVTIDESEFDSNKYSKNLADCKSTPPPTPQPIQVCRLSDKQIVSISPDQFDSNLYSKNLNDCLVTPPPVKYIQVCELSTKKIVSINEKDFDSSKYSKNLDDCKVTPPPVQKPTVDITQINQVPFGASRQGVVVNYSVPGNDSAQVTVKADFGTITNVSKSLDALTGMSSFTFTYTAPDDVAFEGGGTDHVTVKIRDNQTGAMGDPAVTPVTVAPQLPSE